MIEYKSIGEKTQRIFKSDIEFNVLKYMGT